ncbi:MAG: AAA family ATPase [Candidatus Omnitrophica bacterium]|nr:AAA family ATPase [Candidatus Omnitrophota bacterium]
MKLGRLKYYLKLGIQLYWIRIILFVALTALVISLIFFIVIGLRAWNTTESYLRESQLAVLPLQLYLQVVMGLVFAFIYTFLWYWMFFKRGQSGFTKVTKKVIEGKEINIKWSDVIGMDEAKEEALEIVSLIKDRAQLQRVGGQILKGLLMLGPPGCGKTYLAKAIATESGLPFIPISGSEFVEMFVGVGAARIRSLFKKARLMAQFEGGCIIFIDEIDAVGAQRGLDMGFGGTTEHNTTVNQLLVEMDGLKEQDNNIILIGATNAPEKILDQALLRPGRFDRKIYVDMPNLEDRQKLLAYYLSRIKYDKEDVKIDRLARMLIGYSPAEIANLTKEAALITIRFKRELVTMKDIDEARERIVLGIKRRVRYSEKEKWATACHEAGHAVITYLMVPTRDVFKITITPRGQTGGVTWTPDIEEVFIPDKNKLLGEIKSALGSYAAEKIKLGYTTSGVSGDFTSAFTIAHNMVWRWGMGKSGLLGNFHALDRYYPGSGTNFISEDIKSNLDNDVQEILQTCMKEVEEVLKKEEAILDKLAKELVIKEELNYDEIEAIFKEFGKNRAQ